MSEEQVRATVIGLAGQHDLPIEKFFEQAAAKHAPDLCRRRVSRRLKRFRQGCGAPQFVKDHVHYLLDSARRNP